VTWSRLGVYPWIFLVRMVLWDAVAAAALAAGAPPSLRWCDRNSDGVGMALLRLTPVVVRMVIARQWMRGRITSMANNG
jgi:hypothetical protein